MYWWLKNKNYQTFSITFENISLMDHTFGKQPDAKARHDDQTIEDAIEEYLTELDEKIVEGMNEEPIGTDRKLTK